MRHVRKTPAFPSETSDVQAETSDVQAAAQTLGLQLSKDSSAL